MQTAKRPRALGLIVAFLVIVLFVTVYTFVLQLNYSNMAVDTAVAWDTRCADAIHRLVSNTFTRDDFENITTRSDMSTERYYELQSKLNALAQLDALSVYREARRGRQTDLPDRRSGPRRGRLRLPRNPHRGGNGAVYRRGALGQNHLLAGNRGHYMGAYFHGLLSGEGRLGRNRPFSLTCRTTSAPR